MRRTGAKTHNTSAMKEEERRYSKGMNHYVLMVLVSYLGFSPEYRVHILRVKMLKKIITNIIKT